MKKNHLIISVFSILALLACAKETDADKIADAQSCLDAATVSDVDGCLEKVTGLESEGSYLIRCAGAFIKEGFSTPSKLSTALSNLSSSGGSGGAASTSVISAVAFTSKSTSSLNSTYAQETYDNCAKSKSNGLILLSGLSLTATVLWDLAVTVGGLGITSGTPPTAAELQTLMASLSSNSSAKSVVGAAAVSMYETNCQSSNSAPGSFCAQFQSSVTAVPGGTSNPSGVGQQLMTCYGNPNAAGCSSF